MQRRVLPPGLRKAAPAPPNGAPPGGFFSSLRTRDFDEMAEAFHRWKQCFRQLGRGPFQGELQFLQLGGIQVFRAAVNRAVHAQGCPPPGSFGCAPVLAANQGAVWRGRHLKAGQVRVLVPGQETDHVTAADYQMVSLVVDGDLLRKCASVLGGFDPEERLAGREALTASLTHCYGLWAHLVRLLDRAEARADLLFQPEAGRRIEHECVRRLVGVLAQAGGQLEGRPSNRGQLVHRAEDYLRHRLAEPLSVFDLCQELGVSERALHYAFREVRGVSPMAYVKAKRLNAVRQELKVAGANRVHEVAQRWGFWHTGEFAADYRRLFGERPSETLRRAQVDSSRLAGPSSGPLSASR